MPVPAAQPEPLPSACLFSFFLQISCSHSHRHALFPFTIRFSSSQPGTALGCRAIQSGEEQYESLKIRFNPVRSDLIRLVVRLLDSIAFKSNHDS
jgi:hypothetical protein